MTKSNVIQDNQKFFNDVTLIATTRNKSISGSIKFLIVAGIYPNRFTALRSLYQRLLKKGTVDTQVYSEGLLPTDTHKPVEFEQGVYIDAPAVIPTPEEELTVNGLDNDIDKVRADEQDVIKEPFKVEAPVKLTLWQRIKNIFS